GQWRMVYVHPADPLHYRLVKNKKHLSPLQAAAGVFFVPSPPNRQKSRLSFSVTIHRRRRHAVTTTRHFYEDEYFKKLLPGVLSSGTILVDYNI
ncbi:hypothetical protein, partial [Desulfotomaculum copahuensis]|uniref:hypothetical protein n=1 Tax=Desulfotomaculum copahuensis TaxID=1838280 RepID=UPI001A9A52AF